MKHLIIGTAGHIDHGKTQLIGMLTGRNTDRLKEEQKRGISIDLGFTFFDLPSGIKAGIIDVPGHEKFIKNMLAGVMGIDLVLLVVAADEGIMPQTLEHLNILELIGMKMGIVVITKIDMVEEDWLNLVEDEVKETIVGTFLEDAPIVKVSSIKNIGKEDLINEIDRISQKIENTEDNKLPRLPIDRVFTIKGLGTIITGTLISGILNEGDEVEIYPKGLHTKIRSIEVHDETQNIAFSRQRVALNIPGIKKSEIERGDVVALPKTLIPTMMIDCKMKLLKNTVKSIKNRTRVRLYIGSKEVLARLILLDREEILQGEEALVQFRLEEEITAQRGDRFIMRFYSPMFTIGGGEIIDANPKKHKRYSLSDIDHLKDKASSDEITNIYSIIDSKSKNALTLSGLQRLTNIEEDNLLEMIGNLFEEKKIRTYSMSGDILLCSEAYYIESREKILKIIREFHKANPYANGMSKEELLMRVFKEKWLGDHIIYSLAEEKIIKIQNHLISLFEFEVSLDNKDSEIKNVIINKLASYKYNLIRKNDFLNLLKEDKVKNKQSQELFHLMLKNNEIIILEGDYLITKELLNTAKQILKDYLIKNYKITLGEYRTLIESNRKATVSLLEYFDNIGLTEREEDYRVLIGEK